jgi:F-type H+-transporting ATPase subunit a
MFASGFSWFRLFSWVDHDRLMPASLTEHSLVAGREVPNTAVYLHAWLAVAVLIGFAVVARMGLEAAKRRQGLERYLASDKLTALTFAEVLVGGILSLMNDLLDRDDQRRFFPLVAGLFCYIFVCNIQSIFPGFFPPTDDIDTNVGMAIISFLTFNVVGLSRDPIGYLKHLAGPALLLAPFMFFLEVLSLFIRPVSLTIRLTANMFGDHLVFGVMSGLVPLILPSLLLILACVVSVVQAFVFSLLTIIYIHLALPHHEHEEHEAAHAH